MVELISSQTARLAKEKGFKDQTDWVYSEMDEYTDACIGTTTVLEGGEIMLCPSQTELHKWLREKHNIHVVVRPFFVKENEDLNIKAHTEYRWSIAVEEEDSPVSPLYKSWEVAMENGLRQGLNMINLNDERAEG